MGLATFFRNLFGNTPTEKETVAFKDLDGWLKEKEREDKEALAALRERVRRFAKELDGQVKVLEAINVDKMRTEERAKAITKGNLEKYIGHARRLKDALGALDEEKTAPFLEETGTLLASFSRKAHGNYEKATLLVGKELAETKALIGAFAKGIAKDGAANGVAPVKDALDRMRENEAAIADAERELAALEKRGRQAEKDEQRLRERYERENEEARKEQARYEEDIAALNREVGRLRGMVDFKALGNVFHASTKMAAVKEYRDGFNDALEKGDKELLALLDEAKLSSPAIIALAESVRKRRRALQPPKRRPRRRVVRSGVREEQARARRRLEKARQEREALKDDLKAVLERMDIILEL